MAFCRADWIGIARVGAAATLCLTVANCGKSTSSNIDSKYGVSASPRVIAMGEPVPKGGGSYRVGKPYQIAGKTYVPEEDPNYKATGIASWYGDDFHGRKTANGEIFDMNSIAAAHPTLPLPSYVRVTNLSNKRSLVVRVNDRGPYHDGRVIDVSVRAAELLDFHRNGIARVKVEYVGRASVEGSDDIKLAATLRHDGRSPAPSEVRVAAAKPFVPEYFDPKPMVRRDTVVTERPVSSRPDLDDRTPLRPTAVASVQLPPPAPTRAQGPQLASAESVPVPAPSSQRMVWNSGPAPAPVPAASFESRFGTAQPAFQGGPSTAYAPARYEGVVSGRGLY